MEKEKEKGIVKEIYGYARVSTREQKEDRQIAALLEIGVPRKNIFLDKMSGKDFERPQYKKLLKKMNKNSVLFIKSIDRLGRNYRDLSEQWRILTKEKGADVVVLDMPILDTRNEKNLLGTLISDLVLSLLSYVAESEYKVIHERQAEGIAAAKAKGVQFGRRPNPLPQNFEEVCEKWQTKAISLGQAALECGMPAATFYYKARSQGKKSVDIPNGMM